ncbi:cytochrome C oxidase Cbb3 [Oleiphilus sp. HI0071]|nr:MULTISPECIES: cytochrome-c oxidase, cbb3-type subunit III [unclassified Oleiphilus]KZY62283.1 cytochrome C oxidase Cbb3 [Oleiphilus sp. HI0065]KZY85465.1 cytochrome C oxidase Cbb3 [Oleiphilus sp. HI0071]KZY99709.1 cytochrome C oxidase Cbb3 [Oleiphilus sp. HI0073]KZZ42446.1 cytochrome C oxidase Cbb3 [Oleiphilus sp. HI0118]KZZ48162.1 cytochrome C oxidase Cbb3 [Oleiphilus sp. HI0122]KZZ78163.1 cytochrome C oxidase Cbb3 [Oleiphilus sp. HI0133]KZZ78261.1 cytochrome C oxidase Cbb3 [Oleiphilus s
MTSFWSFWVSIISLGSIFGSLWLIYVTRKSQTSDTETEKTMGHTFDGIEEYDNPLPKWWMYMFVATCVFGLAYYALYPGLGNYKGLLGWTQVGQWENEVQTAEEKYGPIFEAYAATPIDELVQDAEAMKVGQRLFANNCAVCHGSAGRGAIGFPNLTDDDWLYGGTEEAIKATLVNGRMGNMPAKGLNPAMTNAQVDDMVHYLLSFSDRSDNSEAAERGAAMYQTACAACHGADAKGNQALGAPNLTDNVWLYGSTPKRISHTLLYGRAGVMPAQLERLGEEKIHLLTAYVKSLSQN